MATSVEDIINRALQMIGTRTTVTADELAANSTNEAIQANLAYENVRDDILRMAPWTSAVTTANLALIYAAPDTPENPSAPTSQWQPGQPIPPWAYEYAYPADCLRALTLLATSTSTPGIPISPVTNYVWAGSTSIPFKVQTDTVNGAPARVILTNLPQPTLSYIAQVIDPTLMDPLLESAVTAGLAALLVLPLTGDKKLRQMLTDEVNRVIEMARVADSNEEFYIPDYTPDWIRVRGIGSGPYFGAGFNWGGLWA